MASALKNYESSGTKISARRHRRDFVVCISNRDYPASLELRKIYARLRDPDAEADHLVRIIDESGEDYLYPADYFLPIELTPKIKQAVEATEL